MPLITFWRSAPEGIAELTVEQIVANAGDGNLRDGSSASNEFRQFLGEISSDKLAEYAADCLNRSFPKSGQALQDIINELGRRLEYDVENGKYQGTTNSVGYDGLWRSPEDRSIVVEVKTTDAYRINLDKIASYRLALISSGAITEQSSILIIVGRNDTGDLEAQIRGSRHAWDVRLISIDSLLALVRLKESAEEEVTAIKIRSVLTPFEYTRLDGMIDIMFTAAKDLESGSEKDLEDSAGDESVTNNPQYGNEAKERAAHQDRTSGDVIASKRKAIMEALGKREGMPLIARGRALFWSADKSLRAVCTISKRYERSDPYWYAYHPAWHSFLGDGRPAFFVLGCTDLNFAFSLPYEVMVQNLSNLNQTIRENGENYWHIKINQDPSGKYSLQLPLADRLLDLSNYKLPL